MAEPNFADIGKIEAISRLFEGTPYEAFHNCRYESGAKEYISTSSAILLEGIDFNLEYFPLKHLGYKSVIAVTGELYAGMVHPVSLDIRLGISSKLDFAQIKELWGGVVFAAREHGYKQLSLDLVPSKNGLCISVSASGTTSVLTAARRSHAKSKDLICISGRLGAAYFGFQTLERRGDLEKNKMLVGAYLRPELSPNTVSQLEDAQIYPSFGYFVTRGLADAVKRLSRDSGLGAKIYADKIPFEGNTFALGKEYDIDPISAAMNGGDDYQLLFTVPILSLEAFRKEFQTFDIIGHLAQPEAGTVLVSPEGVEFPLRAQGWVEND